jgi:hypothetical protein
MSGNNTGKAALFCLAGLSLIFVIFTVSEAVKIYTAGQAIKEYRAAAGDTPLITGEYLLDLEERLMELRKEERDLPAAGGYRKTMTDTIAEIRGLLRNKGIEPERFRLTGRAPDESAEFIIRGSPIPFLYFLMEISEDPLLSISYISIKPNYTAGIDITMRLKNAY